MPVPIQQVGLALAWYFGLLVMMRLAGKRLAGQTTSFDLVVLITLGVVLQQTTLLEFRGKHGIAHSVEIHDAKRARIVKQSRDLPGQELFQYIGQDGLRHGVGSGDINDYLRAISEDEFTAKDFRTWAGTVLAARALQTFALLRKRAESQPADWRSANVWACVVS